MRMLFLLSSVATLSLISGCSSSSSPGGGGDKDSGSAKDTGTSHSSDAAVESAAPSGKFASCVPLGDSGLDTCFAFALADGGSAATVCAADTANDLTWASQDSCAAANLGGCCGMGGVWQCFYGNAASAESSCTGDEGTWSKTAP